MNSHTLSKSWHLNSWEDLGLNFFEKKTILVVEFEKIRLRNKRVCHFELQQFCLDL